MAHDSFDLDIPAPPPSGLQPFPESLPPPPAAPRHPGRHVLAGVAGACVLGAGLGLWARPAEDERRVFVRPAVKAEAAAHPTRQIQIVVDDRPAPLGPPLEVMPALDGEAISIAPAPQLQPEPAAPVRPPAGLVRVLATPAPLEAAGPPLASKATPRTEEKAPAAKLRKAEVKTADVKKGDKVGADRAKAAKDRPRTAEAKPASKTKALAEKQRKADAGKAESKRAKAEPDRKASKTKLARNDAKTKAATEKTRKQKDEVKLAKAERKAPSETAAKTPSRLAKAVKKAIGKTADKSKTAVAETAGKQKLADARKAKPAKTPPKVEKADSAPARKAVQPVRDAGPLRMVSNRCASTDPAAALVCADPSLGAADRRLNRAYREAEAAGVSASELRRQQQRWLAARAAAAREAPWAVQDVYQARIAELEDLTRGAARGY